MNDTRYRTAYENTAGTSHTCVLREAGAKIVALYEFRFCTACSTWEMLRTEYGPRGHRFYHTLSRCTCAMRRA